MENTCLPGLSSTIRCISGSPVSPTKPTFSRSPAPPVAGGITSYMEMPNTKPQTLTQELLEDKYQIVQPAVSHRQLLLLHGSFQRQPRRGISETRSPRMSAASRCSWAVPLPAICSWTMLRFWISIFRRCSHAWWPRTVRKEESHPRAIWPNRRKPNTAMTSRSNYHPHHTLSGSLLPVIQQSGGTVALAKKHNTRLHILHIVDGEGTRFVPQRYSPRRKNASRLRLASITFGSAKKITLVKASSSSGIQRLNGRQTGRPSGKRLTMAA